ncbi:FecR family protein [Terrarubrum flagellatum]|uniref:FecR family protein n=1 Tax=Terrirubrum flagellatum TaxID=2895980 RepID=UPI003144E169
MRVIQAACGLAMTIAIGAITTSASAQSVIGLAERSVPNVTGTLGARRVTIAQGGEVHQNEVIQTSENGRALLQFKDSTILDVSANSSVKLDRYVFNADASAKQAVVTLTRGTFRWVTGASNPAAFKIQTPHATIGIRGTIVEFEVVASATNIQVLQGEIYVCRRANALDCATIGDGGSATVGNAGISAVAAASAAPAPGPSFSSSPSSSGGGGVADGGGRGDSGGSSGGGGGTGGGTGGTGGGGGATGGTGGDPAR